MTRLVPLALLLLPCLAALGQDAHRVESEHYLLVAEGDPGQAAEFSRVLEAAWTQYKDFFGAKPKLGKGEKLEVFFFESREAWAKAIEADKASVPGDGGGLYWPASKRAYVYRQPTVYNTRMLLLHEAAHQYHYLARTRNDKPESYWYTEGVAEYLARHFWDGQTLVTGVVPLVSLSDYAAKALEEARTEGFDLEAFVDGKAGGSRPLSWALYRYLVKGNKGKPLKGFSTFQRKMDAGNQPGSLFRKIFGPCAEVHKEFVAWLEREQEPFAMLHVEWEGVGENSLRGFSPRSIACRLKMPVAFFKATMQIPDKPGWRGGVLLTHQDQNNYAVALLDWGGFVRIARFVNGGWQTMEQGEIPGLDTGRPLPFQLFRRGKQVSMMIGAVGFGPWELDGEGFGLAVDKSDIRFTDIAWK